MRELAEAISREVGYTGELEFDASKPDGASVKIMGVELGRKLLNWSPPTSFEEGLRNTVAWVEGALS